MREKEDKGSQKGGVGGGGGERERERKRERERGRQEINELVEYTPTPGQQSPCFRPLFLSTGITPVLQ